MAGNTFGTLFKVTTFGESHGAAIGAVIDGCPAGIPLNAEDIAAALDGAKPSGAFETSRHEANTPELLSGVFEGKTLGLPIAVLIRNTDARPHDYEALKMVYRPGHADFAYEANTAAAIGAAADAHRGAKPRPEVLRELLPKKSLPTIPVLILS